MQLCPHFGPCGGCQLQNLDYSAQLASKAERLQTLLDPTKLPVPEIQLHASPPFSYRNRIRLTLAEAGCQLRVGYIRNPESPEDTTPRFLPITECPIAAPILWRAAEALVALINQRAIVWLERAHFTFDQIELFTTADESNLQISLFVRTSTKSLPARFTAELASLCEALRSQIPQLSGAGIYLLPIRSLRGRRTEVPKPGPTYGALASTTLSLNLQLTTCN